MLDVVVVALLTIQSSATFAGLSEMAAQIAHRGPPLANRRRRRCASL